MFLMNKISSFFISFLIVIGLSGCFTPDLPKHDIVSYSYYDIEQNTYTSSAQICLKEARNSEEFLRYSIAMDVLHKYLQHQKRDNYDDKYLSYSTHLVTIKKITKVQENCYKYIAEITPKAQKQLSVIKLDITYFKVLHTKDTKSLFNIHFMYRKDFSSVIAYNAALKYVPNMPKVDTSYEQYCLSLFSVQDNRKKLMKTIEVAYQSIISGESIYIANASYDVDFIKARFVANVAKAKENQLHKIYNAVTTSFIRKNGKKSHFIDTFLIDDATLYNAKSYVNEKGYSYQIETNYMIEIPKNITTQKVYVSPVLHLQLSDIYLNNQKIQSSTQYYVVTPVMNEYGERVVHVLIKSKKRIHSEKLSKYFQALEIVPMKVGPYKRGGLSKIRNAPIYTSTPKGKK